jgi:hypothetical protein
MMSVIWTLYEIQTENNDDNLFKIMFMIVLISAAYVVLASLMLEMIIMFIIMVFMVFAMIF